MDAESVVERRYAAKDAGLKVSTDVGLAADALFGRRTLRHNDLGIAIPASNAPGLRRLIGPLGFVETHQPGRCEHTFVAHDPSS
ncbi:MAG: hypothetical protein QNJ35_08925 [Paracoccaceae bacterium]|nr:hypothetical protein [Paracoccaceae bacterium]